MVAEALGGPSLDSRSKSKSKQEIEIALRQECEECRKTIHDLILLNEQNEASIKTNIQHWALTLEKIFLLHGQEWAIANIGSDIVNSLRTVGIAGRRLTYVYDSLDEFPRFYKKVDHSVLNSQTNERFENFYKQNADRIRYHIAEIERMFDIALLKREDAQDITEEMMDAKDRLVAVCKKNKIAVCEPTQDDFDGSEDRFAEKVKYPETKPSESKIVKAWDRNLEARHKVRDRLYKEGIQALTDQILIDKHLEDKIEEAIDADTFVWEPFTDRKWRKSILQWFEIVKHSIELFKHSASTKYKTQTIEHGFYRGLTRESIGGNREKMLQFASKVIEMTPYMYLLQGIWWYNTADKRGAEFSINLSDKLSDRSIR